MVAGRPTPASAGHVLLTTEATGLPARLHHATIGAAMAYGPTRGSTP